MKVILLSLVLLFSFPIAETAGDEFTPPPVKPCSLEQGAGFILGTHYGWILGLPIMTDNTNFEWVLGTSNIFQETAITYTWTDGAANGTWADANNWSGGDAGTYPDDANDKAVINTSSRAISTPATALTIGELQLGSGYSGTLTLGATLTLDDSGELDGNLTIAGGTLDASATNYQINIDGNWSKTGGVWNSRSGTVDFTKASSTQTLNSGGTSANDDFYHVSHSGAGDLQLSTNSLEVDANFTNSTGTFDASTQTVTFTANAPTITTGTNTFYHVSFTYGYGSPTISGTLYVAGNLYSNFTYGYINGNITLNGSTDQTVTGWFSDNYANGAILTIAKSGGSALLGGSTTVRNLTINSLNTFDVTTNNYQLVIYENYTNSGTFTPRSGTLVFGTNSGTITPGTDTYNNVSFTYGYGGPTISGTLFVAGNLYSNFTYGYINGNITLNGSTDQTVTGWFSGSYGDGTILTIAKSGGSALLGGNTRVRNLTINSLNTLDVTTNNYQLTLSNNYTNSGTFNPRSGTLIFAGHSPTITPGTDTYNNVSFTYGYGAPSVSGTLYVAGNLSSNFTSGTISGNITLSGSTDQSITGGSAAFDGTTMTINKSGGSAVLGNSVTITTLTINANKTFNCAGYNLSSTTFTNNGTLQLQGDETVSTPTNSTGSTVEYTATSGSRAIKSWTYANATVKTSGAGAFTLPAALDCAGINITAGTLDVTASNYQINVSGNWSKSGGTFTAQSGTVVFDGGNQTLTGSTTFYNFYKADSTNDATDLTLTFDNTATQTISGLITLDGLDADDRVNLVSNSPGTQWSLTCNGTFAIDYVDVTDSDASGGTTISHTNTVNGGNNLNWGFPSEGNAIFWGTNF